MPKRNGQAQTISSSIGQPAPQMGNNLPNWLNVVCVSAIFATAIYGAILFLDPQFKYDDQNLNIHNFRFFFPAFIAAVIYAGLLFITSLFNNYDLATVVFLLLLFVGFCVLAAGVFTENEHNRVKFFEVASAVLGLGLGIPFGEKLRQGHHTR